MKYISAEKLIAEIERRLSKYDPDYTNAGSELKELLSFIRSLQQEQPEVDDLDLEVKIENEVEKMVGTDYFKQLLAKSKFVIDVVLYTARHFYELGLNARKEK